MRVLLPLSAACLLLTSVAVAQDGQKETLVKDSAVQQSQEPQPSAQGVRSPTHKTSGDTQAAELADALAAVRRAPPDLQGTPVPRPNPLASEPDDPQEPTRSQNPSDLTSQEAK
jgi:hypothetical protein